MQAHRPLASIRPSAGSSDDTTSTSTSLSRLRQCQACSHVHAQLVTDVAGCPFVGSMLIGCSPSIPSQPVVAYACMPFGKLNTKILNDHMPFSIVHLAYNQIATKKHMAKLEISATTPAHLSSTVLCSTASLRYVCIYRSKCMLILFV